MNLNPLYTEIGVHTLIAKWTAVNGNAATYTAITITVQCLVASFTAPSQTDISYTVYDNQATVDIAALTYVQTPACNYQYSGVYTWTGLNNYIQQDNSNTGKIDIHSIRPDTANSSPYSMSVTAVLTIADNNGS